MHAMSTRGALHGGCGPHGARKSILSFLVLLIGLFGKKNCVSINKNVLRRQTAIMRSMVYPTWIKQVHVGGRC